jgi:hypothetical protein
MGARIATAASLLLLASLGSAWAKGKPDKPPGDGGGGGSSTSPVDYELTMIPGIHGDTHIWGVNSSGFAVGTYYESAGVRKPFWTDAGGAINRLDNFWALPAGWRMGRGIIRINDLNQVGGFIVNDLTSDIQIFSADRSDKNTLKPLGSIGSYGNHPQMNNNGDIVAVGEGSLFLYCRSLDELFELPVAWSEIPTGINDSLQISFVSWRDDGQNGFDGSFRYSFDPASENDVLEDLSSTLPDGSISLARDITSNGSVVGFYYANEARKRNRKARAGFMDGNTLTWGELDAPLPTGGDIWIQKSYTILRPAASALGANESGQVVGGYDVQNLLSGTDLWLLDLEDGLLHLDDLVVAGADASAVDDFLDWTWIWDVTISETYIDPEPAPETGYGVIAGSMAPDSPISGANMSGFILTPRLVQP